MALCYARRLPTWIRGVAEGRFFYAAKLTILPQVVGGKSHRGRSEPTRGRIRR
jgi:hypothetical protein